MAPYECLLVYVALFSMRYVKEINGAMATASYNSNIQQLPLINKIFNKTICSSSLNEYDAELISCPSGFKFSIINAYLFDFGNENCTLNQSVSLIPLEFIRNKVQSLCASETSCFIFKEYLLGLTESYTDIINLGCNIFWSCYRLRKEGEMKKKLFLKGFVRFGNDYSSVKIRLVSSSLLREVCER